MRYLNIVLVVVVILLANLSKAQRVIFADNFEQNKIDSAAWQIVEGNWSIGEVDKMRIAPAEGGYKHVLCSGGMRLTEDNSIRLYVSIPDSLKAKKIKISFYYYILASVVGTKIEAEFYQDEMKDGVRGRPWVDFVYRKKGRWSAYQKTVNVAPGANSVRIVFYGLKSSAVTDKLLCLDNIVITAIN